MHATNSITQLKTKNSKQKTENRKSDNDDDDEEKLKRIFIHSHALSRSRSQPHCLFVISRVDAAARRPHSDLYAQETEIGR